MKFLITSDLHLHPFRAFARIEADGTNSRLASALRVWREVCAVARARNVDAVLFCGDLWESPSPSPRTRNLTWRALREGLADHGIPLYLVPGNHDIMGASYREWRYVSFAAFEDHGHGLIRPMLPSGVFAHCDLNGCRIGSIPYMPQEDIVQALTSKDTSCDVLLLHAEIAGLRTFSGFRFEGPLTAEFLSGQAPFVFVGHLHDPYQLVNVVVPGSPLHMNFGDSGNRYVWLLNLEEQSVECIPTAFPHFRTVASADLIDRASGDYYRVQAEPAEEPVCMVDLPKDSVAVERYAGKRQAKEGLAFLQRAVTAMPDTQTPRQMHLVQLRLEDFLTWRFFATDITASRSLLQGDNGVGKTSMCEALLWALYGKTTKAVPKDDVIRWGATTARVQAVFEEEDGQQVSILRERTGSREVVTLSVDGNVVFHGKVGETQVKLDAYLGVSYELFLQMVYFSQRSTEFFADLTDAARKRMVSNILGMERWSRARELVKDERSTKGASLAEYTADSHTIQGTVTALEKSLQQCQADKRGWKHAQQQRVVSMQQIWGALRRKSKAITADRQTQRTAEEQLKGQVDTLTDESHVLEEQLELESKCYDDAAGVLRDAKRDLRSQKVQRKEIAIQKDGSICLSCGSVISAARQQQYLAELDKAVNKLAASVTKKAALLEKSELSIMKAKFQSLTEKRESAIDQLDGVQEALADLEHAKDRCTDKIQTAKERVKELKAEKCILDGQIQDIERRLRASKQQRGRLEKKVATIKGDLDTLKYWQRAFGPEGIPALLLDEFCTVLQREVNTVLRSFGDVDPIRISATTTTGRGDVRHRFDVSVEASDGQIRPLGSNSGGQMTRVNFAAMIALNKMLCARYGVQHGIFGVQIFDELFADLDPSGLTSAKEILDGLPVRAVFAISHDPRMREHFDRVMRVRIGEDGTSEIYRE